MDRINGRIAQVYGYAVCFICVIIILVSTHSVIDAAFDYSNPAGASEYGRAGSAASYEVWRSEFNARRATPASAARDTSMTEKDLRKLYDAERSEQLETARFHALRSLVSNIVFLILATAMFLLHWRWIRRANAEAAPV